MEPRNPTADREPDFEGAEWEGLRTALTDSGKTHDEAVEILLQGWKNQHERNVRAWDEWRQQQERENEEAGDRDNGEDSAEWRPTPGFLDLQPAQHVMKRLKKKEYVELWYFTAQGCQNAAAADLVSPDETFGFVSTEKGVVIQSVNASTMSSKVIRDEDLSWEQITEGKTRLVGCMGASGWSEQEVKQLARFYLNLDVHPIRSQQYGPQAVMRYLDKVRKEWVNSLRMGNPFAIGSINDELLKDFQRQVALEIQAWNNVSTCRHLT